MLFDQAAIGLVDRRPVGSGLEPQNGKCGRSAGHGQPL
jgi:hypothetical protein